MVIATVCSAIRGGLPLSVATTVTSCSAGADASGKIIKRFPLFGSMEKNWLGSFRRKATTPFNPLSSSVTIRLPTTLPTSAELLVANVVCC